MLITIVCIVISSRQTPFVPFIQLSYVPTVRTCLSPIFPQQISYTLFCTNYYTIIIHVYLRYSKRSS